MPTRLTTEGLIIRENNNVGEADRFVTALTGQLGVVRASARGAQKLKSRNAAATRLLTLSRLSLIAGRDHYIIDDARPVHSFFELNSDITTLALAQYFCEIAGVLAPRDEPAEPQLQLLCGALHHLATRDRPAPLVKAVTELRLLTLGGLMPDLTACARCHTVTCDRFWLSPRDGRLLCDNCGVPPGGVAVPPGVLAAMRHIVSAPAEKCFSFALGEQSVCQLAAVCESYLLCQLGRGFKTLDFYRQL